MQRPKVIPENYQQVFSYYPHESQLALKGLHKICGTFFWPKIRFDNGAKDKIAELLAQDHRLIISCNHVTPFDQFFLASVLEKEPFTPIVGNTVAWAKHTLFKRPGLRRGPEMLGMVPVFRRQDTKNASDRQRARANIESSNAMVRAIADGKHLIVFPQGARSKRHERSIGQIKSGIGRIASQSSMLTDINIAPICIWYGDKYGYVRPSVFIGEPLDPPFSSPSTTIERLGNIMQKCFAEAQTSTLEIAA